MKSFKMEPRVVDNNVKDGFFKRPKHMEKIGEGRIYHVDDETEKEIFDKVRLEAIFNISPHETLDPNVRKTVKDEFDYIATRNNGDGSIWYPLNVSSRGFIKSSPSKRAIYDGTHRWNLAKNYLGISYIPCIEYSEEEIRIGIWKRGIRIKNPEDLKNFNALIEEHQLMGWDGNGEITVTFEQKPTEKRTYTFDYGDLWDGVNKLRAFESGLLSEQFKLEYFTPSEGKEYDVVIKPPQLQIKHVAEMASDPSKRFTKATAFLFNCRAADTDFLVGILRQMDAEQAEHYLSQFRETHSVIYIEQGVDPDNIVGNRRAYPEDQYVFRTKKWVEDEIKFWRAHSSESLRYTPT